MMVHASEVIYFQGLEALETVSRYDQIITSLQATLPNHCVQSYFEQKPTLLADADHIAVAWNDFSDAKNNNVIGLIAGRNYTTQNTAPAFLHISTLHVAEAQQKSLLLKRLIAAMYVGIWQREGDLPTWTAIKTFNPSVYNALLRLVRMVGEGASLYPMFTGSDNKLKDMPIKHAATHIAARLQPDCFFDISTGAVRGGGGTVGGGYWPVKPRSSHSKINNLFDERLAPTDRMLCIFGLDERRGKPSAVKLLTRWTASVTSKSLILSK